jgi:hypothetical protein
MLLRWTFAALLVAACSKSPRQKSATSRAVTSASATSRSDDSSWVKRVRESNLARRRAWILSARPCEAQLLVDTVGWREARFKNGRAAGVWLPRGFVLDSSARFIEGGVEWRDKDRSFARVNGFWGPPDADASLEPAPCRLSLFGRPYLFVEGWRSDGGAWVASYPDDTAWSQSEGLFARSAHEADLALLWTIVRYARLRDVPLR